MKKVVLITCSFFLMLSLSIAQNSISLNINHKLGDVNFELDQASKNNMDHDFKVIRLEYYISEISLVHDGGTITEIEDLFILVNADNQTKVDLGEHNINTLERVNFSIGVDPDHNHLDPASFPSTHPLAPKWPSMHWGWAAGYRFIAMEGFSGPNLDQKYELHGLGDSNYTSLSVEVNIASSNDVLVINLDADYTRLLDDIALTSGVIEHGEGGAAKACLENIPRKVFTVSSLTSSTIDFSEVNDFEIYPNPVVDGTTQIKLDTGLSQSSYDISLTSVDGKQLLYLRDIKNQQNIDLSNMVPGLYFFNLIKEGHPIIANRVFIK